MARIQTPQHVQELQAEFKVREPFGLELLETIQPTYSLGRQKIASTGYPRKCIGQIAGAAGGVGTNIEVALQCPANTGIVALVTRFSLVNLGGSCTSRITDGTAMATVSGQSTAKAFADGRLAGRIPETIMDIANPLTAAPNGLLVGTWAVTADEVLHVPTEVILGGGAYFLIRNGTANGAITVNFEWTEFLLEDR